MPFKILLAIASLVAGGVASVVGFGIGSLLTPTLALETGTKLAVAAVAIPHFVGSLQRFWLLRAHVDRRVLLGFGVASAAGGLAGALLHPRVSNRGLAIVFGALLILAGVSELNVPRTSFVATATAIALFVDAARLPVYLATQWHEVVSVWPSLIIATVGVVVGTALGTRVLGGIPERVFRRTIAVFLLGLGFYMVVAGGTS